MFACGSSAAAGLADCGNGATAAVLNGGCCGGCECVEWGSVDGACVSCVCGVVLSSVDGAKVGWEAGGESWRPENCTAPKVSIELCVDDTAFADDAAVAASRA